MTGTRRAARVLAAALLALLAGCVAGPGFKPPAAPAVSAYRPAADAPTRVFAGGQRVTPGKAVAARWWSLFRNPVLDRLVTRALAGNHDLAAARARLAAASEAVTVAQAADKAQVSLAATAGRQKYGVALFGPGNTSFPAFSYYSVGPVFSMPLDLAGGTRRAVEAKAALRDFEAAQLEGAYLSLAARVVAEALDMAQASDRLHIVERIVAEDRRNIDLVRKAMAAGAGTRTQLLAAQSQLTSDRTLLPDLRQQRSVARHALAVLVGEVPADWHGPDFRLDELALPANVPLRLPAALARARPDIRAAEAKLHAASAGVGVATANLYPHIELSANLMQEALSPGGIFRTVGSAWNIAASLTQPLLDGGRLRAEKRAALDAYREALESYRQVLLDAFAQVADDLQALQNHAAREQAQRAAARTAREALALARRSFAVGDSGILDVIDAERRYAQAQLGLAQARAQRYLDVVALFWALGGKLPGTHAGS